MKTQLSPTNFEEFYIRLYFNPQNGDYFSCAANRAYRDFSRTLRELPEDVLIKNEWKESLIAILKNRIQIVLKETFVSQDEFTDWHERTCNLLVSASKSILTIGHSQKWVNMTLKYLFVLGENRTPNIGQNYRFFHIPIDNIIQERLEVKHHIIPLQMAWSQIPDYETYYTYQKQVMSALNGKIIMDEEFILFNESNTSAPKTKTAVAKESVQ